jgi:hypothetical protein
MKINTKFGISFLILTILIQSYFAAESNTEKTDQDRIISKNFYL